nr:MAG TPA: hypothetical protein [Microviridae sp.]
MIRWSHKKKQTCKRQRSFVLFFLFSSPHSIFFVRCFFMGFKVDSYIGCEVKEK